MAASGHGTFAGRQVTGGPGGPGGGFGFGPGGPGGPGGRFGSGFGGRGGGPMGGGADALLGADVLTPAAAFLGISATTLESDLAGGKTLAAEAQAKGKTAADLISAIVASEKTVLDGQKAAGWLTADQETAAVTRLTAAITAVVNNVPSASPAGPGAGGGLLQIAATYLGVSVSDLLSDLKSGKSLADVIGTVSGKTVDGLVAALEAQVKTKLDSAVSSSKITQAQEDSIISGMTTSLTNLINDTKSTVHAGVLKSVVRYANLRVFALRHA